MGQGWNQASERTNGEVPLSTLKDLTYKDLRWVESHGPEWKYILRADDVDAGSLTFDPESESRAVGEICGQRWTFTRQEDSPPCYIQVHAAGQDEPVATLTPRWGGSGSVHFRSGARYCWNTVHFWSARWCFRREDGHASACVTGDPPAREGSAVKICADAAGLPETPVLVLLGWFVEVLVHEQISKCLVC